MFGILHRLIKVLYFLLPIGVFIYVTILRGFVSADAIVFAIISVVFIWILKYITLGSQN